VRVLTRGRRWSVDEEKKLAEFMKAGMTAAEIAKTLGRSIVGVRDKSSHLGLKDDDGAWCVQSSSLSSLSSLELNNGKTDVERSSAAKLPPGDGLKAEKLLSQSSAPSLAKYTEVLGFLKALQDRWGGFQKIRVDFTREGPSIIADMENAGIENAEGVNFSVPRKSEMSSLLKQRMENQKLFYPMINWEQPYRGDVCTELNVERYDLRKDGTIGFSHPQGTHDDVYWAIALAVYSTVEMSPEPFLAIVPR
jgi:hypothetical protein